MMESTPEQDWSKLPDDLLNEILDRLLPDHLQVIAVCAAWRSVYAERVKNKHWSLPFLMIAPHDTDYDGEMRSLYSLLTKDVYKNQVPVPHCKLCRGSCFGWLVTMERTRLDENISVQLHNPFLARRNVIDLPSLDHMIDLDDDKHIPFLYLRKAVLSCNPTFGRKKYLVMAILSRFSRLAYFKPGNNDWIPIEWEHSRQFNDVIFYNQTQQFHAVHATGAVFAIDMGGRQGFDHPIPKLIRVAPPLRTSWASKRYLVESSSGDLLQVLKQLDGTGFRNNFVMTTYFEVFKLGFKPGATRKEWIQMHSLNGSVLFLGGNSSLLLSATEFIGSKPNCIYFTDDLDFGCHFTRYGPENTAIFSLEDKNIERLPHYIVGNFLTVFPMPIWIEPTRISDQTVKPAWEYMEEQWDPAAAANMNPYENWERF